MSTLTELKATGAVANTVAANSLFLTTTTPETDPQSKVITFQNLARSLNQIGANQIPVMVENTPANSTPIVTKGTIFFDANFLYVATADNTLKRVTLTSF